MKRLIIIYLTLCYLLPLSATFKHANLVSLTSKEGLSNNSIYDIHQDNDGFMWFATDIGISRYDGQRFHNYEFISLETDAPNAIMTPQAISNIHETDDRLLWLQKQNGELVCFDKNRSIFIPLKHSTTGYEQNITETFHIDNQHMLYLATMKGLLKIPTKIESEKGKFYVRLMDEQIYYLIKEPVQLFCHNNKEELIVLTKSNKLVIYNINTDQCRYIESISLKIPSPGKATKLYAQDNYVWICQADGGAMICDLKNNQCRPLIYSGGNELPDLQNILIKDIVPKSEKQYYVSTWAGLLQLNFSSTDLCNAALTVDYLTQEHHYFSFAFENKLTRLLYDKTKGILWVGTFGDGIVKFNLNDIFYNQVVLNGKIQITGISEDNKGYIWLTTNKNGILKSDQNFLSGKISFSSYTKEGLGNGNYKIYKDEEETFWIGDDHGGIIHLYPATDAIQKYKIAIDGKKAPVKIQGFLLDTRNQLWIATSEGIVLLDRKDKTQQISEERLSVTAIAEDGEGTLWAGTESGLKQIESDGEKIRLTGNFEQEAGMRPVPVQTIYINSYNQLLVSYSNKILRIDKQGKQKTTPPYILNGETGNSHVYCMIDDLSGNIWMGSNSGVMTVRNNGNIFYNYSLSGNYNAVCRLHNGNLIWVNSWGLVFFDPQEAKNNRGGNEIYTSDIAINNKIVGINEEVNDQILLKQDARLLKELSLNHQNKNLTIYFADLHYGILESKIAYRLLPDHKEWSIQKLKDGVSFEALPSGIYTLQVKKVYPNESEGDTLELKITVQPHWSLSWWAISLYILLTGYVIWQSFRFFRKPRLQETPEEKEETEEKVKECPEVLTKTEPEQHDGTSPKMQTEIYREPQKEICPEIQTGINQKINAGEKISSDSEKQALPFIKQQEEGSSQEKKKLLIVEDNNDIRLYLKLLLSPVYHVITTTNGQEGIDMAKEEMPDIILCDVMMPVKNGIECCHELKEDLNTCQIPVIMLTAKNQDEDILQGIENGADDYVTKPFNPDILKAKIKNLIKSRQEIRKSYERLLHGNRATESEKEEEEVENPFITSIIKIIEENIQEPDFNVKKLASEMNMSQPTLYRKVKQNSGYSIIELIIGVRMKRAAELLKQQYPVQEVAELVGYNDIPTFRKNFIDFAGITPSSYASSNIKQQ